MLGLSATSAPEEAIASASRTRFALPERVMRELRSSAQAMTIALSRSASDCHLVSNTAGSLGPDGKLIGKYRKVCLPHGEVEKGIAPGHEYPVFDTAIGKVGLMVCYDGFFPEVARELSNRGAEVIAWPVWGCNPNLAAARACENHVYLVRSTYEDASRNWMPRAVFDHVGGQHAKADKWGTVVGAAVEPGPPVPGHPSLRAADCLRAPPAADHSRALAFRGHRSSAQILVPMP